MVASQLRPTLYERSSSRCVCLADADASSASSLSAVLRRTSGRHRSGAPAASLFSPWLLLILQLYLSVLILYNLSAPLGPFFLETRAVLGGTFANFGQWVGMDAFFRHFAGPSTISSNLPRFPRPAGSRAASCSSPALLSAVNRFSQTLHGLRAPGRDLALLRRGERS